MVSNDLEVEGKGNTTVTGTDRRPGTAGSAVDRRADGARHRVRELLVPAARGGVRVRAGRSGPGRGARARRRGRVRRGVRHSDARARRRRPRRRLRRGAITHAARTYPSARFARANLAALRCAAGRAPPCSPSRSSSTCGTTRSSSANADGVLRPGGLLLVTTPNRSRSPPAWTHRSIPSTPTNSLQPSWSTCSPAAGSRSTGWSGLHAGSRLDALDQAYGGSFVDAQLATEPAQWHDALRRDVGSVGTADFAVLDDDEHPADTSLDLVVLARVPQPA